jgi:hypothetical protein
MMEDVFYLKVPLLVKETGIVVYRICDIYFQNIDSTKLSETVRGGIYQKIFFCRVVHSA